jgi:hypothetical protein
VGCGSGTVTQLTPRVRCRSAAPAPATDQQLAYSPGTGKTHLSIALGIRACLAGQRVAFRTATEWVAMLANAQRQGRLDSELDRLQRIPLLIVDEVGYIPFDPHAANLMFMLVSRRYERASLIVTSNKPFSAWGEIFGDEVTAAAARRSTSTRRFGRSARARSTSSAWRVSSSRFFTTPMRWRSCSSGHLKAIGALTSRTSERTNSARVALSRATLRGLSCRRR